MEMHQLREPWLVDPMKGKDGCLPSAGPAVYADGAHVLQQCHMMVKYTAWMDDDTAHNMSVI